ncbi:mitogen-activated protein kinase kinase kinase 1-like isoform X3 [Phaseolus vulgaris]|uniref:mitogen-activated protein kinase kinase kinase 1-like isoform X3 n=1 Tax=Phaseolus vulgaris TaxID=3885 RepID=UPI0035CA1280
MASFIGRIEEAIKSSSDSILGKGEYRVRGFGSAVDSGIRSRTASNLETEESVDGFSWAVDNAMKSTVAPNPPSLHSFASAVDNAISSNVDAEAEAEVESDAEAETEESANRERYMGLWQKGYMLGKGSFGTVYEAFADDGNFFAAKEVSLLDDRNQGKQSIFQLRQEISLLSQFRHDNIVQYLGTGKDNDKLYIFLELVTKGSLANLYKKYRLMDSQVSAYTRQILSGLKYLHDRNVIHRDIKCANILVDATGSVKLADFGLAKVTKLNNVNSVGGSLYWMAPEKLRQVFHRLRSIHGTLVLAVSATQTKTEPHSSQTLVVNLRSRGYGLAADIWSLGCTVLEMLTRQPPYSHLEPFSFVTTVASHISN